MGFFLSESGTIPPYQRFDSLYRNFDPEMRCRKECAAPTPHAGVGVNARVDANFSSLRP